MRLTRRSTALSAAAAAFLMACGGGESSGPPKVATVTVSGVTQQVQVGATIQFSAAAKDSKGNPITGRTATWQSSSAAVASVDNNGVVTGVTAGQATITATVDNVAGTLQVTVVPIPVAAVLIENRAPSVREGGTVQLTALAQDAIGRTLAGRTIAWSSANAAIASVSNTGLVSALTAGSVYIRAESEGKRDSVSLRVRSLQAPTITATSGSATWTPGQTVTVTGTNFSPVAGDMQVFVNGVAATVTGSTATTVSFTLPGANQLPCTATGPIPIIVAASGDSASGTANVRVATQRTLGVGESALYIGGEASCNEYPVTGGTYLITAYNYNALLTSRTSFQLVGAARSATSANVSLRAVPAVAPSPALGPLASQAVPSLDRFNRGHLTMLERNRDLMQRKGNPAPAMRAKRARERAKLSVAPRAGGRGVSAAATPVAPPVVGEMLWRRMPKCLNANSCFDSFDSVRARVVYSGSKLVILEDSLAPLARTMDVEYQRIGAEFDDKMFKYLSYFGDPLAVDSLYDNNGRVFALFSKKVNDYSISGGSLLGYVTLCDFFPSSDPNPNNACPPSNEGEYFYAFVPNPNATGSGAWSLSRWRSLVRSTLIHEMKHVVMYAERIRLDADFTEESWLEEATAQQAAELWSRDMYGGFANKADIDWANGPRCDYATASATCPDPFEGIMHHFGFLYRHYTSNETKSILTQSGVTNDLVIYGSSWSFARYVTDVFGGSDERAFLRNLVQQQSDRGISNVVGRTGKSWNEMFGYFSLASLADNYPGGTITDARAKLPSWNTRDVFSEMSARLFTTDAQGNQTPAFPRAWPMNVRTPAFGNFADFTRLVTSLPGGGWVAWEVSGVQTDPQTIGLRNLNGIGVPNNVGLAVLRVK